MDRSLASDALLARGESSGVDGGGQLIDAVSDGVRPRRRKAQEQAIGCTTPDEVRPERGDFYPSRPRFLIDELFVDILEVRHRVQSRLDRSQLKRAGACPLDRVGHRFETLAIGRSHPAQVPRVVTVDDEVGKRHLFEKGRMKIRGTASGEKTVVQIGRDHDEAEAQRRKDRFREGADVDHAAVRVETVQARKRARAVPELAVVVVLYDPRAGTARPLHQLDPARGSSAPRTETGWT